MSQRFTTFPKRPGLVTFAAAMMFLLAGFYAAVAFMEFFNATWLLFTPYNGVGGHVWIWGIVDAVYAVILLYAGYGILAGGQGGRIIAMVVAILSAVRWLFYLPIAPVTAVVIIAINVIIIYGLVEHAEYFHSEAGPVAS